MTKKQIDEVVHLVLDEARDVMEEEAEDIKWGVSDKGYVFFNGMDTVDSERLGDSLVAGGLDGTPYGVVSYGFGVVRVALKEMPQKGKPKAGWSVIR